MRTAEARIVRPRRRAAERAKVTGIGKSGSEATRRSTFVTVVARVFIVGSAPGTLVSILQAVVLVSMPGSFDATFGDTTCTAGSFRATTRLSDRETQGSVLRAHRAPGRGATPSAGGAIGSRFAASGWPRPNAGVTPRRQHGHAGLRQPTFAEGTMIFRLLATLPVILAGLAERPTIRADAQLGGRQRATCPAHRRPAGDWSSGLLGWRRSWCVDLM